MGTYPLNEFSEGLLKHRWYIIQVMNKYRRGMSVKWTLTIEAWPNLHGGNI